MNKAEKAMEKIISFLKSDLKEDVKLADEPMKDEPKKEEAPKEEVSAPAPVQFATVAELAKLQSSVQKMIEQVMETIGESKSNTVPKALSSDEEKVEEEVKDIEVELAEEVKEEVKEEEVELAEEPAEPIVHTPEEVETVSSFGKLSPRAGGSIENTVNNFLWG